MRFAAFFMGGLLLLSAVLVLWEAWTDRVELAPADEKFVALLGGFAASFGVLLIMECWWGPVEKIEKAIGDRKIIMVKPKSEVQT